MVEPESTLTAVEILKALIGFSISLKGVTITMHWMFFFPALFGAYQIDKVRIKSIKKNAREGA